MVQCTKVVKNDHTRLSGVVDAGCLIYKQYQKIPEERIRRAMDQTAGG